MPVDHSAAVFGDVGFERTPRLCYHLQVMQCADCDRLMREYIEAMEESSSADAALGTIGGTLPLEDYRVLLIVLSRCQKKESAARLAYREHLEKEHR